MKPQEPQTPHLGPCTWYPNANPLIQIPLILSILSIIIASVFGANSLDPELLPVALIQVTITTFYKDLTRSL